jgi:DNA-binding SARP family transcriptional activator
VLRTVQGYRLALDAGQSDAVEFTNLVTRAARAAASGAAASAWRLYAEAVNCWRGPLLAGAGAWTQIHPAAIALSGRRIAAVLAWAELGLSLGTYSSLVPALRTLAVEQPLHEGLAARLMLALAGAGQQAEALAVYEDVRDRLSSELGVDPGPEISAAHLRVLRGQLPGAAEPRNISTCPHQPAYTGAPIRSRRGRCRGCPSRLNANDCRCWKTMT